MAVPTTLSSTGHHAIKCAWIRQVSCHTILFIAILILAVANLSSRKTWEQGSLLVILFCSELMRALAEQRQVLAAPGELSATLPGPDRWQRPGTGCVTLLWGWPALSLGYLSAWFLLGRSWQWCHLLVMLSGDLVLEAGSAYFYHAWQLSWGNHCYEPRREKNGGHSKGITPPTHPVPKP